MGVTLGPSNLTEANMQSLHEGGVQKRVQMKNADELDDAEINPQRASARVAPAPPSSSADDLIAHEISEAEQAALEAELERDLREVQRARALRRLESSRAQRRRGGPRQRLRRWFREQGPALVYVLQGIVAVFQMFVIPYQMCMVPRPLISLNTLYVVGYVVDFCSLVVQGINMHWVAKWDGWSRALLFNAEFRQPLTRFLLAVPIDLLFWLSAERGVVEAIPYVRLIHLFGALEHGIRLIQQLQRSPAISYNIARILALLLVICISSRARRAPPPSCPCSTIFFRARRCYGRRRHGQHR